MDTSQTRLASEREFHDRQAATRARSFAESGDDLRFNDADYLDHETWIRPAFDQLGDLSGKSALDYGCGHGMAAVVMARQGANVTAFDLSPGYVAEAAARASANDVSLHTLTANAEHLPFDDASFDAVWGCAILHHLDLDQACVELKRVMRPGAVAVFCEPWGENPLIETARQLVPYPNKHRTRDEHPLRRRDLITLRRHFPDLQWQGFQLLGTVRRVCRHRGIVRGCDRWDHFVLSRWPGLRVWCRYVVLSWHRS